MMAANGLFIVPLPKKQPYDFIVAQNSKAGKLVFINATPGITGASIDTVARDIIDNQLPNDEECFYFISFTSGSRYRMIVQKYINNDYAAYILFGYAKTEISYHVKLNGVWK